MTDSIAASSLHHASAHPASVWCAAAFLMAASAALAQTAAPPKPATPKPAAKPSAAKSITMAQNGHCAEALPLLRAALPAVAAGDERRSAEAALVRCAMQLDRIDEAVGALRTLNREFPGDPEVLSLSAHVYSDLSLRATQELMRTAPGSPQLRQLNAETLEAQGKWDDATREYRAALAKNPDLPGIHFRIGRLLLSRPGGRDNPAEARAEFEAELQVNPDDALSEYVLGELDSEAGHTDTALPRFQRATKLDASFTEAWLALGQALMRLDRGPEAIAPLNTAAKQQPDNPQTHFQLANAYRMVGRTEDAARELQLQKEASDRAERMRDQVNRGLMETPGK